MYYTKNNGQPLDGAISVVSINGAEYQVGQDATSSVAGIMKLYSSTGQNTDGAISQSAFTSAVAGATTVVSAPALDNYISVNVKTPAAADGHVEYVVSSKGIDTAISSAINSWAETVTQNGSIDTFKEIIDWIADDVSGAVKIIADITALQNGKKDKQTAVANTAGATDSTITSLTQDTNGVISYTIGTIQDASSSAHGLMTSAHYTKLEGIAAGAEVNVQSDWNETNTASDAYIQNKPDLSVYALVSDVEDNELVVASALNDLNSRITEANGSIDTINEALDTINEALDDKIMREICSKELAQPGYLVLNTTIGGVSNDIYMSLDAYEKYGGGGYTVIGIVVKPYNPDTNEVICMSTKYMSLVKPEQGSTDPVDIKWGDNTTDTSLTNYGSSSFFLPSDYLNDGVKNNIDKGTYWFTGTATDKQHVSPYISSSVIANVNLAANDPCNDTDGRSNSLVIAGITTATHTSGGTINNSSAVGNYPVNDACRYYNMGGRSWYLPAMGELQFIVPRFKEINASFSKFSKSLTNNALWSSTEFSQGGAWRLYLSEAPFGYVGNDGKSSAGSVVAFAAF